MARGRGMARWTGRLLVVLATVAATAGCQALKDALPTKSSEPTPSPSQSALAIPVVLPSPSPTPTPILGGPSSPTPTPSPAATPTPSPTSAPPTSSACSLPPSNSPDAPCTAQSPSFLNAVEKAITQTTQQYPAAFGNNNNPCETCYYVKDEKTYINGVINNLAAAGYCAVWDGEEIGVKNSNSFNDQYDILLSSGHIRRGNGAYRTTCTPSWF